MSEHDEKGIPCFHYSTKEGGLVHVDVNCFTGEYYIIFRLNWGNPTITHSAGYHRRADANRMAETLVPQIGGRDDIEGQRSAMAFMAEHIGKSSGIDRSASRKSDMDFVVECVAKSPGIDRSTNAPIVISQAVLEKLTSCAWLIDIELKEMSNQSKAGFSDQDAQGMLSMLRILDQTLREIIEELAIKN